MSSIFQFQTQNCRPAPIPTPIRNPITLICLWASKTDPRLVALCSRWAIATQAAQGFFVFATAMLAFAGAYYTISSLHAPPVWARSIAVAWALFCLFLDREIVGGLEKSNAIVRPLLALCLGALVAIPIELWILRGRIDKELRRQYIEENAPRLEALRVGESQFDKRVADLAADLNNLRKQEAQWASIMNDELVRHGSRGGGSATFRNARNQQTTARQRIQEVHHDLERLENGKTNELKALESRFQREEIGEVRDFVTQYEALHRVIHSSDVLYWLSWMIRLTLILIEMTPAMIKVLTPHVDYHHLVRAEMRENIARADELSDRNYQLAIEEPERPQLSVSEKLAIVRYAPARGYAGFGAAQ